MVGRGSTDDKGPILGWINVLEAHHHHGMALPVNLRFCFEGMEESGSQGLNEYLATNDGKEYFAGVTDVCIVSSSYLHVDSWTLNIQINDIVGQLLAYN